MLLRAAARAPRVAPTRAGVKVRPTSHMAFNCRTRIIAPTRPLCSRGDELRLGRVGLHLLAQPLHVDVQCVVRHVFPGAVPDGITQVLAGDELALMLQEVQQQPVLQCREEHLAAVFGHSRRGHVEPHIADREHVGCRARAPQRSADARDELAGTEGLGDVVDSPHVEARHRGVLVIGSGEEDDGHIRRRLAGRRAHGEPIALGQRHVQKRDIEIVGRQRRACSVLGRAGTHGKALAFQKISERPHDGMIVLNQQNPHDAPFRAHVATISTRAAAPDALSRLAP